MHTLPQVKPNLITTGQVIDLCAGLLQVSDIKIYLDLHVRYETTGVARAMNCYLTC